MLLRTDAKGLTEPHPTSKPAWFDHFSTVETGYQSLPFPTGAKASMYSQGIPDHPQDLLPSRNRAFMGSHSLQGVHHEHHPLRSTATRRALGLVTQDAGALARHWHRTKVHPTAWQGHLPFVRHRGLRKRVPGVIDCRVPRKD